MVAQAYWGEGVGSNLIEALLDWAGSGGVIRKIDLRVRTDNLRAIALYERLGFTIEGCLWAETQNVNGAAIRFYESSGFALCGLDTALYDPQVVPDEIAVFFALQLGG